jgi:hypothetical protein
MVRPGPIGAATKAADRVFLTTSFLWAVQWTWDRHPEAEAFAIYQVRAVGPLTRDPAVKTMMTRNGRRPVPCFSCAKAIVLRVHEIPRARLLALRRTDR